MSKDLTLKNPNPPYTRNKYPVDSNFNSLCDNWELYKSKIAIFLGAGASFGAVNNKGDRLLGAYQLRNEIWSKFMLNPKERENYDFANIASMTLEHASAIAQSKADRLSLTEFIRGKYIANQTLWQHAVMPFMKPKAIFTTNYDNLIELGFQLHSGDDRVEKYDEVFDDNYNSKEYVPIYKPHGSVSKSNNEVGHGGIVISQFDYFDIHNSRANMLKKFVDLLSDKCVIFIGYSFMDFDISRLIYDMARKNKTPRWYAVFPRNDDNIRNMYLENYQIKQINRTFFDFLIDLDEAVDFIPKEWKFANMNGNALKTRIQGYS